MDGKIGKPLLGSGTTCNLGETGKLLRRALVARSAPPDFREHLRRQLVAGRIGAGSVLPSERLGAPRAGVPEERTWS